MSTKTSGAPNAICAGCGSNWSSGEFSQDCVRCDGFALTRPCPICAGRCGKTWTRAVIDLNDERHAVWLGRCQLGE